MAVLLLVSKGSKLSIDDSVAIQCHIDKLKLIVLPGNRETFGLTHCIEGAQVPGPGLIKARKLINKS